MATALVLAAGVYVGLAGADRAEASAAKQCPDVVIRNYDGSVYTGTNGLFAQRTSCRIARKVAHWFLVNDGANVVHPKGFTCSGGVDDVTCRRGSKRVTWSYYDSRS